MPYFHGGKSLSTYLRAEEVVKVLNEGGYLKRPYIHWCAYSKAGDHIGRMTWTTYNAVKRRVKTRLVTGRIGSGKTELDK